MFGPSNIRRERERWGGGGGQKEKKKNCANVSISVAKRTDTYMYNMIIWKNCFSEVYELHTHTHTHTHTLEIR